jgi:pancreatic triacylglycerol lipase
MVPSVDGMRMVDLSTYEAEPEARFNPRADMFFLLYTRSNPTTEQRININDPASVAASNFNPAHPTRFIIHGWQGSAQSDANLWMRAAYLARGDFNCISIDWGVGAGSINYITARNNVDPAGELAAEFMEFMLTQGADYNRMVVVGHSLGSHVGGFMGRHSGGRINTIIATDPAGVLFSLDNPDGRLDETDAQYVESIITNGGTLGMMDPISDATFYPNGGSSQPGCGIDITGACAHARSNLFLEESIRSVTSPFLATRCANFAEITSGSCTNTGSARMGGEPSNHGRGVSGVYALTTNAAAPFAQG